MVAAVESMAYVGETPWHKLGENVTGQKLGVQGMIKKAKLNWTVSLRKIMVCGDENPLDSESWMSVHEFRALVRDSDNMLLDVVGSRYLPTQNADAFQFFNEFVESGGATMHTMGSLRRGRMVWALADLGNSFKLAGGDEVRGNLLVALPHEQGKSIRAMFTPVRVVCWNTLTQALGAGGGYRQSHRMLFDSEAQAAAKQTLGLARESMDKHKEQAVLLSRTTVVRDDALMLIAQTVDPDLFDGGIAEVRDTGRWNKRMKLCIEALDHSPGHAMKSAQGTLWGVVNAVTYAVDHKFGRGDDQRLNKAWFGQGALLKQRVLDAAMKGIG